MTQTGPFLHLYLEVGLGQEEKGGGGEERSNPRMLKDPDLFPSSHRTPSPRRARSPGPPHCPGTSRDPSPTRPGPPPPHHTRGSQHLGPPPAEPPYPQTQRSHGPDRLLQVHTPPETLPACGDPCQGRGMLSVPPATSSPSRPSSRGTLPEEGRRSVVTFSYVQKASVQSPKHAGTRQAEPQDYRSPEAGRGADRADDPPLWVDAMHSGQEEPEQIYSPWGESPHGSPYRRRTTQDSSRTPVEEGGSPDLRRRLAGGPRSPSLPREPESYRCRSWGGSPVLPRTARTLPASTLFQDPDPASSRGWPSGPPRSPILDRPSSPFSQYSYHQPAPDHQPTPQYSPPSCLGDGSPWLSSRYQPLLSAGRPTDIQHPSIPASPPCRTSYHPSSPCRTSYHASPPCRTSYHANDSTGNWSNNNTAIPHIDSNNVHQSARNSMHPSASSSPYRPVYAPPGYSSSACDASRPSSSSRSCSPARSPELARKLALEASRMSPLFTDRRTPSPMDPSWPESSLRGGLIPGEPQPCASLHGHAPRSQRPDLEDHAPPLRAEPDPAVSAWPLSAQAHLFPTGAPASPARSHCGAASASPVLDPRNQHPPAPSNTTSSSLISSSPAPSSPAQHRLQPPQYRGEGGPKKLMSPREGAPRVGHHGPPQQGSQNILTPAQAPDPGYTLETRGGARTSPNTEEDDGRGGGGGGGAAEEQRRGGVWSSQSSSGVTGSVSGSGGSGWVSQTDVEGSLSPENSSQSSQRSGETPATPQGERVSDTTARSQKIAQAKWEFLFGVSTEDQGCPKDTTTTGSTPPPSLHLKLSNQQRGWEPEDQRLSHHEVQQMEVEVVTLAPPQHHHGGSAPKTGIIRRAVAYSETDLDAVPLRCYRETDLDEVMLAQEEEVDEDSAFGSNRSTLGTSGSGDSSAHSPQQLLGDAVRQGAEPEREVEEEEEEEEEGGVASWASVRMQGDRKRQQEDDQASWLLTRRPVLWDGSSQLKSPLPLPSPPRLSDGQLDSFSRHFESIVESHRAKGTSYSSLDSVDLLLTPGTPHVFTFDLPTLTPHIQSHVREGTRQKLELCFAPLVKPVLPGGLGETSRSETTLPTAGAGLNGGGGGAKDDIIPTLRSQWERESWRRANIPDNFHKANSAPSLHGSPREHSAPPPPELLHPQADVAERLAQGGGGGGGDNGSGGEVLLNGTKADLQAARRLAKRLHKLDGFRKSDVMPHLSKNNEFSKMVAEEYLSYYNFTGLTIDRSLRVFLKDFALMGETQERERVLCHFSARFLQCNPDTVPNEDSVHTLTCAVMLLNTDLHGPNIGKRMSCGQFVANLEGLNEGQDFPKEQLKALYSSIKKDKLQWTIDEEDLRRSMSELADGRTDSASHTLKRATIGGNSLGAVAPQADAQLYKEGFLVRKVHADPDGKRTPRGKRAWRSFYVVLKGLVLHLQKGECGCEEDLRNAVSVHHSLAMRAADYRKRDNVFYLRTADWRVFLLQAPSAEHMQSWITRINVVAAMFSAPPFPAAIGSQKRFSRPLLPGSPSTLTQEEQVKSHEIRFRAVCAELADRTRTSPERRVKGRELEEQKLRQEYLEFEQTRYGTYAMLLRAKMSGPDQDLGVFEARLLEEPGIQRAKSSPTLPQDGGTSMGCTGREKNHKQRGSKREGGGRSKRSHRQASTPGEQP